MTDWKKRRNNYIEKVREEYKVKEGRGMTEDKKTIKCPICSIEHVVDKYNWIDSCKGYMHLIEFEAIVLEGEKDGK